MLLLKIFTYSTFYRPGLNLSNRVYFDGVWWSVKYFFYPEFLVFRRNRGEAKKDGENMQVK